jgi:uncharacterized protein (TIGR02147 family)
MNPANLYDHLDYRAYLKEYYDSHKARNPSFSYGAFARIAGFKSKGLLHDIMTGRKSLSKESAFRLAVAMKLDEKAISYFQILVDFCQATSDKEKAFLFRKLMEAGPRTVVRKLREDGYEFYSQWYYHTLRELLPLIRFKGDYEALGRMLNPPITGKQAHKAVDLLLELGLLEKTRTGFRPAERFLSSGEVDDLAIRDFHLQNLELAARSIDAVPREQRDMSCVVATFSKDGFERLKREIDAFRKRILRMSEEGGRPDRICQIGLLVFPTTSGFAAGAESALPPSPAQPDLEAA